MDTTADDKILDNRLTENGNNWLRFSIYNLFIKKVRPFLIPAFLFALFLPLSLKINYMQNDDWVHYLTVQSFLRGDFHLNAYLGSTFYAQGFLGYLWSLVFSLQSLSVLTLLVSCGVLAILNLILIRQFKLNIVDGMLLGLLFFFNPLFIYSSFGFMIENFVLFFIAGFCYFFNRHLKSNLTRDFIMMNAFLLLGFFTKHYVAVIMVALIFYYGIQTIKTKKHKFFVSQLVITAFTLSYFKFLFPVTAAMQNRSISLSGLFDSKNIIVMTLYLGGMLLPYLFTQIPCKINFNRSLMIKSALFIVVVIFFYMLSYKVVDRLIFPYLPNTFTRYGFFPGEFDGNKYHFAMFYKIFETWQLWSIFGATFIIVNLRKFLRFDPYILIAAFFGVSLLLVQPMYDRYFLPLIFLLIVHYASKIHEPLNIAARIGMALFLCFEIWISTVFLLDYHGILSYETAKTSDLVSIQNVKPEKISANRAYNMVNNVDIKSAEYYFTFDKPSSGIIETHKNTFKFSPFIDPYIYLVKRF